MEHINWIYDMIPNMIKIIFILFFSSIIISLFLYIIAKLLKIFHISKHFKFYKHIYGIYIILNILIESMRMRFHFQLL